MRQTSTGLITPSLHSPVISTLRRRAKRALLRTLWRNAPHLLFQLRDLSGSRTFREDRHFLDLYRSIYDGERARMTIRELFNLYTLGRRAADLRGGDFAEVGVYRGGSAKVLGTVKGNRPLWLFDTFAGMPETDPSIDQHRQGDFADTSLESVRAYLADVPDVRCVPGFFPTSATGSGAEERRFAFVNLDVDLYRSTFDALAFFYPRMILGGMIVSHDYMDLRAVREAVDDFFADKPETVIPLWDTQCVIVMQAHRARAPLAETQTTNSC